jgi:hypothetical protein
VFSIVLGQALGLAATAVAAAMFLGAWVVLPLMIRHRMAHPDDEALADQKGA